MKILYYAAVAFILVQFSFAGSAAVMTFRLGTDGSAANDVIFAFGKNITEPELNYTVSGEVRNVEVFTGAESLPVEVAKSEDASTIRIRLNKPADAIRISYVTDNVIFQSDSAFIFLSDVSLNASNISIRVILPAGYGITGDYMPAGGSVLTDGKRISVLWEMENAGAPVTVIVKFSPVGKSDFAALAAIMFAALAAFLYVYYRKKTREEFLRGFSGDEKKTVEYLATKKVGLQKDLEAEFKFSRAKATRITSKLEGMGLIRKQRYGRTNKLFWQKK
ncbi:MAG: hypothetical protein HY365_03325 [Candidatus Aenigmarchaeota archaeon]|nr:hypothetical protein [Candidatus Aenigmarchaeota archaeon]